MGVGLAPQTALTNKPTNTMQHSIITYKVHTPPANHIYDK
jgi:hypothetical protein